MNGRLGMTSSGLKVADATIASMTAQIWGIQLLGDGTNAASLTLYDNASSASGLALVALQLKATDKETGPVMFNQGLVANNGIFADVSGTGASYIVYYTLGA